MENKEKIYYSITPAPGVSLLDWYLSTVDYLVSELRKYTEVELIDNFGMLERANEMRHTIGYSVETDGLLLSKISDMIQMHYRQMLKYCPELAYGEFIHDNYKWLPEEFKRYCIVNYVEVE